MLVELFDRRRQAIRVELLDPEATRLRLLRGDHQRPGDVATVAGEQVEGLAGRQVGLLGQRLQRVALRQQALAEGEGVLRASAERQAAGDDRAVLRPAVQRLVRVAATDATAPPPHQLGDGNAIEPDAEAIDPTHPRPGSRR